jgi:hypothetical protein
MHSNNWYFYIMILIFVLLCLDAYLDRKSLVSYGFWLSAFFIIVLSLGWPITIILFILCLYDRI